jgi:thiol:disulfide interchange protein
MRLWPILLALAALLSGNAANAQLAGMETHVHAALEAETLRPAAGSKVTLAITMRPDAGWHGYWSNPGDAGEGLSLDWKLPAGATVGSPRFPVPETLIISGFMNYVYKAPHSILMDLEVPAGLAVGTKLPVSVDAYWLACTDRVCVPQQGKLSVELTVGDGQIASASRARFDAWRAALPVPLDRDGRYAVTGKRIAIAIPYPATAPVKAPYFFPETSGLIDHMAAQSVRRSGDWLIIETMLAKSRAEPPTEKVKGLVRIGEGEGLMLSAQLGDVPSGGQVISGGENAAPQTPPLYLLLLGALLGGLILNVMPCVFPILGLKALALAKTGGNERQAKVDALAYSAGAVLSCVALGAILLGLRAAGQEIGWAFQLQEPLVVLMLLMLMVGITANLAGLFAVGTLGISGRSRDGASGSFITGALAAFVATPCTGPFMASALGAALLLPVGEALLLFAVLGLGLALPFLALAYLSGLRSRLPRPGPWMENFRKAMAVPMALTALALLWLFWRLTGDSGLWLALVLTVLFLSLMWIAGRKKPAGAGWIAFAAGTALVGLAAFVVPKLDQSESRLANSALPSQPFSEAALAKLRGEEKPVFVYFTADWCVTCKINEAAVLESEETAKLFAAKGITVLRGDFTKRSPEIARFLAAQGAAGVPLYLYYPKGGEGQKLPQILTDAIMREAIAR